MRRTGLFYITVALTCALLSACSRDVRREPEITSLSPAFKPMKFKSAAVFNFRLMDTAKGEGPAIADFSADALVKSRVVEEVERVGKFIDDPTQAATLARREMKQLAIFGSIDEYIYGGLSTESRVSMTYIVVEAATGKVLLTLRGSLSEPPQRAREMFFYLDSGGPAPLPINLARRLVESLTDELVVKPPPPKPAPKPVPKTTAQLAAPASAHDTGKIPLVQMPSAPQVDTPAQPDPPVPAAEAAPQPPEPTSPPAPVEPQPVAEPVPPLTQ